jgi:hypothetical protein
MHFALFNQNLIKSIDILIDLKDHHDLKFSDLKSRFDEVKSEFVGTVDCLTV